MLYVRCFAGVKRVCCRWQTVAETTHRDVACIEEGFVRVQRMGPSDDDEIP